MIKTINKIKNVRAFIDFDASGIELKRKNIIYAPNGVGKTTLSRLLNKIAYKEDIDDLLSQEAKDVVKQDFEIEVDAKKINKANYKTEELAILVFNSDYIDAVIRTDDFSSNDVSGEVAIPIGHESNEILVIKSQVEEATKKRQNNYDWLVKKLENIKKQKIEDKQYCFSDISVWTEFTLNTLIDNNFVVIIPAKLDEFNKCETDFSELLDLTDENKIRNSNTDKLTESDQVLQDTLTLLATSKKFINFDEDTRESIYNLTSNWISSKLLQKGIEMSNEKGRCLLCKRRLDENVQNLFSKYESYFINEESKFKQKLDEYKYEIVKLINDVKKKNNNLQEEVNKLSTLLGIRDTWSVVDTEELLDKLAELITSIEKKIENPSQVIIVFRNHDKNINEEVGYQFQDKLNEINNALELNNRLIDKINSKIDRTSQRKTELRKLIGKKFLYEFYEREKLLVDEIIRKNQEIIQLEDNLKKQELKLPKKDVATNIVKIFNKFLHDFLYIKKYELVTANGLIELHFNGVNISQNSQKISEGEKTMIALCYFLSSSIKTLSTLGKFDNGIFVIDDPVNSMGYNFFFGVCSLLKYFHVTIRKDIWGEDTDGETINLQKIILTHNSHFFNMMAQHVIKNEKFYLTLSEKSLFPMRKNQFKSDFDTALINIKRSIKNNEDISIGNDLRRFFETIRYFYGITEFNEKTLKIIFPNFEGYKYAIFYSVVNYYSHGNPESHTDPLPTNLEPFKIEFQDLISNSQFRGKWDSISY